MKKLICMLLACVMLLSCAYAAPRFPQKSGVVVDNAAVLSQQTVEEVKKLHELVKKGTDVELYLVTVDFLDGYGLNDYGNQLMKAWNLDDDALVLLLAVGEDQFGSFSGKDVKVSSAVRQKVMGSTLSIPFLAQEYDEAIRSLMPALVTEVNKAYGARITLDGMFGVEETALTVDWLERALQKQEERSQRIQETMERRTERTRRENEDDDGISLGKIILTFIFLSMIFGKKGRRGGCGCAPFAGMFGLWKLWKRD